MWLSFAVSKVCSVIGIDQGNVFVTQLREVACMKSKELGPELYVICAALAAGTLAAVNLLSRLQLPSGILR